MKKHLLFIFLLLTITSSFSQVPTSERDALIALYNATNGANWQQKTNWNTAASVSTWYGVTVSYASGVAHVSKIDLQYNNLNGVIPIEIGNFSKLEVLTLSGNNISGSIPIEIGNLSELRKLSLDDNNISGSIPTEIGNFSQLQSLALYNNSISGSIPTEIGNCLNLEEIYLERNQLTGSIPASFANLNLIFAFFISDNQLSGSIPNIFTNWSNLIFFSIGEFDNSPPYNNFYGELDLSNNPSVISCEIRHTDISNLNIKNGNNIIVNYIILRDCPNLSCVIVDDATYSSTNWINVDVNTTFVESQEECEALSIDDLSLNADISIYPNPANAIINFKYDTSVEIKKVILMNSLGQIIKESASKNSIDISTLQNGIYLISIEDANGNRSSHKVIKN